MKRIIIIIVWLPLLSFSQTEIIGEIVEVNAENKEVPLPGANVYWLNSTVGDVTDFEGKFTIPYQSDYKKLIISYVGYKTDTLTITEPKPIRHILQSTSTLNEVTVTSRLSNEF